MKKIIIVFKKELLEMLRDPRVFIGMIVLPALVVYAMSGLTSTSIEKVSEAAEEVKVLVWDRDSSNESLRFVDHLKKEGIEVSYFKSGDGNIESIINYAYKNKIPVVVVIHEGFENNISSFRVTSVSTYLLFSRYDLAEIAMYGRVVGAIERYSERIVAERIENSTSMNATQILNPIFVVERSVANGVVKDVSPAIYFNRIFSMGMVVSLAAFFILAFSSQLAAISIGMEKEQRTLESVLSMPVKRTHIVAGKAMSIGVLSVIAALIFFAIYLNYMSSAMNVSYGDTSKISSLISLSPSGIALFGFVVFLTLLCNISIVMLVASFSEDVRGAQTLSSVVYVPALLSIFTCIFTDPTSLPLPLQIFVFVIPFSYMILAAKALYTNDYSYAIVGIPYLILLTIIVMYVTSKFFKSEKILTMRFARRRSR